MMDLRRIFVAFVVVVLLFLSGAEYLYQYAGLKNYIKAVRLINSLPKTTKNKAAIDNFYGNFVNTTLGNAYGGILARVEKNGIWIWGGAGLKYFLVDKKAKYQIMDSCPLITQNSGKSRANVVLNTNDFVEWSKKIEVGDNIVILSASKVEGFKNSIGYSNFAFNWWHFLDADIESRCRN